MKYSIDERLPEASELFQFHASHQTLDYQETRQDEVEHIQLVDAPAFSTGLASLVEAAHSLDPSNHFNGGVLTNGEGRLDADVKRILGDWRESNSHTFEIHSRMSTEEALQVVISDVADMYADGELTSVQRDAFMAVSDYQRRVVDEIQRCLGQSTHVLPALKAHDYNDTACHYNGRTKLPDIHFDGFRFHDWQVCKLFETIAGPGTIIVDNDERLRNEDHTLILDSSAKFYQTPDDSIISVSFANHPEPLAHGIPRAPLEVEQNRGAIKRMTMGWAVYLIRPPEME